MLARGVQLEARTCEGDTMLLLAAASGSDELVCRLLAARADKDAHAVFGDTALIIASRNGGSRFWLTHALCSRPGDYLM
jgi:ankyrin repeat protein